MTASPAPELLQPGQPSLSVSAPSLNRFLHQLQLSPETTVLILAVLIGTGTGLGVVIFRLLIAGIHDWMLQDFMDIVAAWGAWTLAGVPILGGLCVGLMRWLWPNLSHGGSSLKATAKGIQDLSPIRPLIKMLAAAVSLGTGASLGPEGPSVEIGAYFGTALGEVLRVSQERQRLLLGAGAAAGLAAGFNAPIAGVFLALEVVLGTTFANSAASIVLLAAVVSAFIAQVGLGGSAAFTLPAYEVRSLWELPLYMGLGLLACLVSMAFVQIMQIAEHCFQGQVKPLQWLGKIPVPLRPMLGGTCVGLMALQFPQTLGIGYETVESMLQGVHFSLTLLVILLAVKLVMTAISLSSGLVGGIFAPALFLGATLGTAYGKFLALVLPGTLISIAAPPAYAMVGMAAVLAGSVRAPLTAILLLFELTRDYRIVLPLMAAVGLSAWLVERWQPNSTQEPKPPAPGLAVAKSSEPEVLRQIQVTEAMIQHPLMLASSLSALEAGKVLVRSKTHTALILDPAEQLIGIVTLNDISRAFALADSKSGSATSVNPLDLKVSDVCTKTLLSVFADETLAEALNRMATRGLHQLPVVSRDDPPQVLGLLTKEGIDLTSNITAADEVLQQQVSRQSKTEAPLLTVALQQVVNC